MPNKQFCIQTSTIYNTQIEQSLPNMDKNTWNSAYGAVRCFTQILNMKQQRNLAKDFIPTNCYLIDIEIYWYIDIETFSVWEELQCPFVKDCINDFGK